MTSSQNAHSKNSKWSGATTRAEQNRRFYFGYNKSALAANHSLLVKVAFAISPRTSWFSLKPDLVSPRKQVLQGGL